MAARGSARYREMRTRVMRIMLHWYRDILLLSCGADENLLRNRESVDVIRAQARGFEGLSRAREPPKGATEMRAGEAQSPLTGLCLVFVS